MKKFLACSTIAILLIALSACEISGNLLSPAERDQLYSADYRLLPADPAPASRALDKDAALLADGASINAGGSFSVTCKSQASGSPVDAVTVSLDGPEGVLASVLFLRSGAAAPASLGAMSTRELPSVLDAPLPVSLPEGLKPGAYLVRTAFYAKNAAVFEKTLQVFALSGAPAVSSIQACPASASPGSTVLLQARIVAPSDARPYLVWRYGPAVIGAGLLSDGLDQVFWKCPDKEGVYGLKLFVYPFPPSGAAAYPFDSPVSGSAKVVAAAQPADANDPFEDKAGFYSLLDFAGGFSDSGYRQGASAPALAGQPRASVLGTSYGYQLDAERSLSFDGYLLPARDGSLSSFSLMARFMVPKKGPGLLFRSESEEPGFGLSLALDTNGQYLLVLSNRTEKAVSASGAFADGRLHDLIVSLAPSGQGCSVQWFLDYKALARDELPLALSGLPASGRAILGGQESVPAVYDEFGVYASPRGDGTAAYSDAFRILSAKAYRERLLVAEGFEGQAIPEGMKATGSAKLDSGALVLGERSGLALPIACAKGDAIRIDIALRAPSGPDYSILIGPKESTAVRLKPDGSLQWLDGSGRASLRAEALSVLAPSIKLEISQTACVLVSGNKRVELFALGDKAPVLSLGIEAQSRIWVESLLARRLSDIELLAEKSKPPRAVAALGLPR